SSTTTTDKAEKDMVRVGTWQPRIRQGRIWFEWEPGLKQDKKGHGSSGNLDRSKAEKDMVRVGTWIEARPKLIIPGIINSLKDECHITLAYLGDVSPEEVAKALQPSDKSVYYNVPYEPILCEAHGTARWVNADGDHVDV